MHLKCFARLLDNYRNVYALLQTEVDFWHPVFHVE